ncbi:hypothetical protein [Methylomarinum vadi]|uniref:hypothetical protein n=1 Tax=Methylomarinum vadi TaxID=438855 RepID=UPI0004DF9136|nr:hypothetical protein [Methylomarinum vadi]
MFYSLKDKLNRYLFSLACRQIDQTPPIVKSTDKPVAVLTQLQHKDVLMFLIAAKSFAKRVPLSKVIIINDGSLDQDDISRLKQHIPVADIYDAVNYAEPACPSRGCWERLLAIAHFTNDYYVIQLDSDTLTLSALDEVNKHIETNTGFIIGTWDDQEIEPMDVCSERVQKNVGKSLNGHVQMVAEAYFSELKNSVNLNYVRGCAGFSGFPKGGINKEFIVEFSTEIEKLIGSKWHEWGSEQVMTNVTVANLDKAAVLPHPKYSDCNKMKLPYTCFVHFIGDCRFKANTYPNLAKAEIWKLINS